MPTRDRRTGMPLFLETRPGGVVHQIELHQRCAAKAVDEKKASPRSVEIGDDGPIISSAMSSAEASLTRRRPGSP